MKLFSSSDRDEPASPQDRERGRRRGAPADVPAEQQRLRHRAVEPDAEEGGDEEPLGESSPRRREPEPEPERERGVRGDYADRESNGHGAAHNRDDDDERAGYETKHRDGGGGRDGHGSGEKRRPKIAGPRAIRLAREYAVELTGEEPEAISGLSFEDGRWKVVLDVVELRRVPPTTDVLGTYELELDENGGLLGYRRLSRFYRSQVDEG